jgi:hypothetical protein
MVVMTFQDLFHGCSEDWVKDSYRWRGAPMLGKHGHWCPDWDYLPIDENSHEWPCPCEAGDAGRDPCR